MHADDENSRTLSRRTILKASAWTAPVIAVAIATPLAAASTTTDVDLSLVGMAGETLSATDPAGTRSYTLSVTSIFSAANLSDTPVPAGSVITISFDNRLIDGDSVVFGGTAAIAQPQTVVGNLTTAGFTVATEIPANTADILVSTNFVGPQDVYFDDLEAYSFELLPPAGFTDIDLSNNGLITPATYVD